MSPRQKRGLFAARFVAAGGQGTFVAARMGHALMFKPALWKGPIDLYLENVGFA